jgi:hypothetical protein
MSLSEQEEVYAFCLLSGAVPPILSDGGQPHPQVHTLRNLSAQPSYLAYCSTHTNLVYTLGVSWDCQQPTSNLMVTVAFILLLGY